MKEDTSEKKKKKKKRQNQDNRQTKDYNQENQGQKANIKEAKEVNITVIWEEVAITKMKECRRSKTTVTDEPIINDIKCLIQAWVAQLQLLSKFGEHQITGKKRS